MSTTTTCGSSGASAWLYAAERGAGEFRRHGDGTASTTASTVDLRDRMTKWALLTR
ncbi:hypothetical protein [Lentzea indica]|uniref:hypothetical protein n=1 Tax=Lentzea indica TaxID=2604800 RepID=UPI00143BEF61|nr:hypothetical protein [Lentzea indica]